MEELGLFPLPLVLVPTERIPLHIFEPRYRELIGDCLETDGELGLVLAEDEGAREVGTRARVADVLERFADGRLNIVVQGGARFRVTQLTSGRSFLTAEIESFEDEEGVADPADCQRALELYRRLAELAETEADEPDQDSGILSFELTARVDFGAGVKQELLESRSEPDRLAHVCVLLERAARTVEQQLAVGERASTNGKVSQP